MSYEPDPRQQEAVAASIDNLLKEALNEATLATADQTLWAAKKVVLARLRLLEAPNGFPFTTKSGSQVE